MAGQLGLIGRYGPTLAQDPRGTGQGYGRGCGSAAAKVLVSHLNITACEIAASPLWCAAWPLFCSGSPYCFWLGWYQTRSETVNSVTPLRAMGRAKEHVREI